MPGFTDEDRAMLLACAVELEHAGYVKKPAFLRQLAESPEGEECVPGLMAGIRRYGQPCATGEWAMVQRDQGQWMRVEDHERAIEHLRAGTGERCDGCGGALEDLDPEGPPVLRCPGCGNESGLSDSLEMWATWIGDECANGMEDTNRLLCAEDLRRAAAVLRRPAGEKPVESGEGCTCGNWYHDAPCECSVEQRREVLEKERLQILRDHGSLLPDSSPHRRRLHEIGDALKTLDPTQPVETQGAELLSALTVARDALDAWESSSKEADLAVRDKLFAAAPVVRAALAEATSSSVPDPESEEEISDAVEHHRDVRANVPRPESEEAGR